MTTMTKKLDSYPFHGFDFMELADAWGVYIGDEFNVCGMDGYHRTISDADVLSIFLEQVLKSYNGYKPSYPMRKCANDIRIFTKKLSKGCTSEAPMWKGMSKIEDDFTLLSYAIKLMGNMWD